MPTTRSHAGRLAVGADLGLLAAAGCRRESTPEKVEAKKPPAPYVDARAALRAICEGTSRGFAGAQPFDEAAVPTVARKAILFGKDLGMAPEGYFVPPTFEPRDIWVQPGEEARAELVVCVDRERRGDPIPCKSGALTTQIYDMSHTLRILVASTGKELAKQTFSLDGRTKRCPKDGGGGTGPRVGVDGPDFGPHVLAALQPFQPRGFPENRLDRDELDVVCSGSPRLQARAYDPRPHPRKVHVVYFPGERTRTSTGDLPEGFPSLGDRLADAKDVELVACVTAKPQRNKRHCAYPTELSLEIADGVFEVALVEAKTAKAVETKTFAGTSGACPAKLDARSDLDKQILRVEPGLRAWIAALEAGR